MPATDAPAELGSLVGSLQTIEIRKLLMGQETNALIGRQVLLEVVHHRYFVTSMPRNPHCGLDYNEGFWSIHRTSQGPADLSLREALALKPRVSDADPTSLYVDGHALVRRLRCQDCGRKSRLLWLLSHRLDSRHQVCHHCQGKMVAGALDLVSEVSESINPAWMDLPLEKLGLRNGDVITLTGSHNEYHIELGS